MARIDIEKKPRRTLLPLLIALLVIGLAALGIYLYLERGGRTTIETGPGVVPPAGPDTTTPPTGVLSPNSPGSVQLLFWPRGPAPPTHVRI